MSILEPKVAAKLSVEREGDAEAFKETAADIGSLGAAAGDVQAPLSQLTASFKTFVADFGGIFGDAKADAEAFVEAIDEIGQAKGLEQQKAAVEKATAAWEAFGEKVPENVRAAVGEVANFEKVLAELKSVSAGLADPIVAAAGQASSAVAAASAAVESGSTGATRALVQARIAVEAYAEELRKAQAAGATITGDQVAELQRLQSEYEATRGKLAEFRKTQADVRKEVAEGTEQIGGNVHQVGSLGDILTQVNPGLANFALKWATVTAALAVAFTALGKVESGLVALERRLGGTGEAFEGLLADGTIPGVIHGFQQLDRWRQFVADGLVALDARLGVINGGLDETGVGTEELANLQRILRNEGIDPTNLSLDQMRQRLKDLAAELDVQRAAQLAYNESVLGSVKGLEQTQERLLGLIEEVRKRGALTPEQTEAFGSAIAAGVEELIAAGVQLDPVLAGVARGLGNVTTQAGQTAQANERLAASVGASRKELDQQAASLVKTVEAIRNLNPEITAEQLRSLVGDDFQALLDALGKVGAEGPAAFTKLAGEIGVVSSATEDLQKRTDALLQKILGSNKLTIEGLKKQQAELKAVLELVNPKELKFENPEAFTRLQEEVKKVLEGFREFGIKVPQWLADAATGADLFVAAIEVAGANMTPFADGVRDVGSAATAAASGLASGAQATTQMGGAAQQGGGFIRRLSGEILEVGKAAEASGEDVDRIGDRIVEVGTAADQTGNVIRRTGEDVNLFAASAKQAGEEAQGAAAGVTAAGNAAGDAATSFVEAGRKATEAGTAVKTAGKGAKEGAVGFGDLDVEAVEATGAVEELKGAVEGATESIAAIDERVAALSITVGGLVTAIGNLATVRFAEPILAELALVDVKLAEILRKVGTLKQELEG